jgi:pimeloyl-ACP methyl ester carboxylesterase
MKGHLPPAEMFPAGDALYRVRYVKLANDQKVRVVESGAESDLPLLLVHGWGCSAYAFRENIAAVAAAGYRVIAPDLKGHGLSDKPVDKRSYSTAAMVQHIGEIVDALGLRRFAIAGHSMGAALSLRFAIANPRRITALGLLSPVGTSGLSGLSLVALLSPQVSLPIWRALNTRWMTRFFLRLAYGKFAKPSDAEVDQYWAPAQFREFTTALRHLLHELNWGPLYVGGLDAYNIPILVMSGSRDHLCRRKTREHLQKALRTQPVVEKGAGHLILSEIPAKVNAAIIRLLSE